MPINDRIGEGVVASPHSIVECVGKVLAAALEVNVDNLAGGCLVCPHKECGSGTDIYVLEGEGTKDLSRGTIVLMEPDGEENVHECVLIRINGPRIDTILIKLPVPADCDLRVGASSDL